MQPYLDLTGRVALVTGASSGIGAATAVTLADLGARVALSYHRNRQGAEDTRDRIVTAGGTAMAIAADVRRAEAIRALVDRAASELGPIDILVNNAGSLVARSGILELTEARLDEILALNFKSAVLASQAVAASMIERRRGAIVNVVSIAGAHRRRARRRRLRLVQGGAHGVHQVARQGTGAARRPRQCRLARRHRHALPRGVLDTRDDSELRQDDPARPRRYPNGVRDGHRVSRLSDAASYIVGETIEVNGGQLMR